MIFKNKQYSKEEFQKICKESTSFREVTIKLGYSANSGGKTVARIKTAIQENEIDISHFTGQSHTKNAGVKRVPTERYLNNEIQITSHKLRLRLLEEKYFEKKCNCCGLQLWLEKEIPLELHHKDGNKNNNNLSNLELLCPNCHAFTDTYKSKNRKDGDMAE